MTTKTNLDVAKEYVQEFLPDGWETVWHYSMANPDHAGADTTNKVLHLPQIEHIDLMMLRQPIQCVALHELGHANCQHRAPSILADHHLICEQEIEAWEWARKMWKGEPEIIDESAATALWTYRLPLVLRCVDQPVYSDWEKRAFEQVMQIYIDQV